MNPLTFVHSVENGDEVVMVYDSSHGGKQTVHGEIEDAHLSEYTTLRDGPVSYRVWSGSGTARSMGDVVKRRDGNYRKIGTFVTAEVIGGE